MQNSKVTEKDLEKIKETFDKSGLPLVTTVATRDLFTFGVESILNNSKRKGIKACRTAMVGANFPGEYRLEIQQKLEGKDIHSNYKRLLYAPDEYMGC